MDIDKIFEKIPYDKIIPLPSWQRAVAVLALAGLVFGLFYFVIVRSKDDEITKLKKDHSDIQKKVDDNRTQAKKLPELIAKMRGLDEKLKEASKKLPTKKEIPELLEQVSNIGIQSGLEFITFKPGVEVRQEFYSNVPVSLKITGKFHDILTFFDEIAHLPRIVTIDNIRMQSGSAKAGFTNLTVTCNATTYRFLEKAEGKGKAMGKGKGKK